MSEETTRRALIWIASAAAAMVVAEGAEAANVKISAFPDAGSNMASANRVTGLQGGTNVNFTAAQIIAGAGAAGNLPTTDPAVSGDIWKAGNVLAASNSPAGQINIYAQSAATSSNNNGTSLNLKAGSGDGTGYGGIVSIYAGSGGATGNGNTALFYGGSGGATSGDGGSIAAGGGACYTGNGGACVFRGGASQTVGNGGGCAFYGGAAASGDGGDIKFRAGISSGGGHDGRVYFFGLPTIDPSATDAIFSNHSVLMKSGVTNANGTYTIAGIGTKTITIANGIIVSIA